MAKTCQAPDCINPSQSHGFCFRHGYLRTDQKWKDSLERRNTPKKPNKTITDTKKGFVGKDTEKGEKSFLDKIWQDRPHISDVSGAKLDIWVGTVFFYNCFSHLLSKGRYPKMRLVAENISLQSPQEHMDFHSKTREDLLKLNKNWKIIFDRIEELKLTVNNRQ